MLISGMYVGIIIIIHKLFFFMKDHLFSDDDDEVSKELNAKGGSNNESGTQRVVEVNSSQANVLSRDITSAQVARPGTSELEIIEMGKDLKIGVPKSSSFEVDDTNKKMDKFSESDMKKVGCENGAPPKPRQVMLTRKLQNQITC
ncbi:hypothetical protein HanHA300_Chr12g0434121 [Helianthus annuus]|nr:hypothetical protein HanHA300_Chr12g0434121 [Helianthus annuus]KAJ0492085.1 hypothetical protein HanIR_Chr12g0570881 [Helianthus annuus]KAJ0504392.1 hypothetical protein HanHA89_Chr12g0458761 [Helianthus annuus]KAJ0674104.1 hypothetical protein HanLR1_Chr12g0436271 [Helianthus annuus]